MLALVFAAAICSQPVPQPAVAFDALTPADAARLNGAEVRVSFTVGRPAYAWYMNGALHTVCGPDETDEQERTAVLRGDRAGDLVEGTRVEAVGVVRVIRHAEAQVGPVLVPAWDEVRFEER